MTITIGAGGAAAAHANYLRSDPAPNAHLDTPPARVLVGFSEKVKVASSGLTVLDAAGHELAAQAQPTADPTELVLPLPALSDGVYTVAWQTVSAEDGDAAKGYFAFEVGRTFTTTAPPVTQATTQNDVTVTLAVSPDAAGKNGYTVTVGRGGAPLQSVTRVRLRFTPLDRDVGQTDLVLAQTSAGPGTYAGSGFELPFAGRYRVQIQVRQGGLEDLTFEFPLMVPLAVASPSATASAAASATLARTPADGPSNEPLLVFAAAFAVAALAIALVLLARGLLARRRT